VLPFLEELGRALEVAGLAEDLDGGVRPLVFEQEVRVYVPRFELVIETANAGEDLA
jgi:hypothetical protein